MIPVEKAVVVLSGGLDSLVAMAMVRETMDVVLAVTFDYGQHAVEKEIVAARGISNHYNVDHRVIDLPFWKSLPDISLVSRTKPVPLTESEELKNDKISRNIARMVWVPNRNGVFLNVAAVYAEIMTASVLIAGFNREESETFPDNSIEFIESINDSLKYSTMADVRVESPTAALDKKEIVETGIGLKAPFNLLHSCYLGLPKMCGQCPSCIRCRDAFMAAEAFDLIKDRFKNGI